MKTSGIEPSLICDNCCHLERAPFTPGDTHHCGGNFLELEKVPYRIYELEAKLSKVEGVYREQGFTLLKVIKERDRLREALQRMMALYMTGNVNDHYAYRVTVIAKAALADGEVEDG